MRSLWINSLSSPTRQGELEKLHAKLLMSHIYLFLVRMMLIRRPYL